MTWTPGNRPPRGSLCLAALLALGARIAAAAARNLLRERHLEFPAPDGEAIGRSVCAGIEWRR